jgi:hypothetical protein
MGRLRLPSLLCFADSDRSSVVDGKPELEVLCDEVMEID